jgi:hypothetical protein
MPGPAVAGPVKECIFPGKNSKISQQKTSSPHRILNYISAAILAFAPRILDTKIRISVDGVQRVIVPWTFLAHSVT